MPIVSVALLHSRNATKYGRSTCTGYLSTSTLMRFYVHSEISTCSQPSPFLDTPAFSTYLMRRIFHGRGISKKSLSVAFSPQIPWPGSISFGICLHHSRMSSLTVFLASMAFAATPKWSPACHMGFAVCTSRGAPIICTPKIW